MAFKDHFSSKADAYAKARPTYPDSFYQEISSLCTSHDLAWDCGAGNGQASVPLATYFARVVATEPSAAQLAAAPKHPRITYVESAETVSGVADETVDLVTAAQAAHWFDLPRFYNEVRRVGRDGAIVILWTYTLGKINPLIDENILHFYTDVVGPYWPPERRFTENGYRDFDFPLEELPFPSQTIQHDWDLNDLLLYLSTWSSVTRYTKERGIDPLVDFSEVLKAAWGRPDTVRKVTWPLLGRLGRLRK